MTDDFVYSVRMRAAAGGAHEDGGRHVSGAERLVEAADLSTATAELTRRAVERNAETDFVQVTVDRIARVNVGTARVLRLRLTPPMSTEQSIKSAKALLTGEGLSTAAVEAAFDRLTKGPPMRGAAVFDRNSGADLTPNRQRGVRASRFDYSPAHIVEIERTLLEAGLAHFRTREALALATKVVWSGVAAELCWSDESEYVAGYVASTALGYVRFGSFKPSGAMGGRVFFVDPDRVTVEAIVENLERKALWITGPLEILAPSF